MRRHTILLATATLLAAASATAGSLDVWEDSRGAREVTASFPTGPAQQARISYDASSAETGGVLLGVSDIQILAKGSIEFIDFDCKLRGCNQSDYIFDPGTEHTTIFDPDTGHTTPRPGRLSVTDFDSEPKLGSYYDVGTITFHAPQEPGQMPLVKCYYTDLEEREHTCSPFVLVTVPEPHGATSLFAGAALLIGALRPRQKSLVGQTE